MKKRVNIYVDENLHKEFKLLCVEHGISVSEKINRVIKSEVEKNNAGFTRIESKLNKRF